jgi:hypothetical protein
MELLGNGMHFGKTFDTYYPNDLWENFLPLYVSSVYESDPLEGW